MPVKHDGGALRGGAPRVVWFSSESDPRVVSARSVAADLLREGSPAHLVWNPCSGEIVQMVPVTRAGRLMDDPVGHEGRVCVQVMVVGHARDPFTGSLLNGLDTIMEWLDAWRVTRHWPAGPPLPSPQSYHARRVRRDWARGGHFGASQVPGLVRPDPGGIDIRRVTGPDTPVTALPRQRPIPSQEAPHPVPPEPLPRTVPVHVHVPPAPGPDLEPAAAVSRLPVPLPRTELAPMVDEPVALEAAASPPLSGSTSTARRPSAPLAASAPPPVPQPSPTPAPVPPKPVPPVPAPVSMRS